MFRRYEMRFVRHDGRVLRGPILNKKEAEDMQTSLNEADEDMGRLFMYCWRQTFWVPREAFQKGHLEIKPVGLLYVLFRFWRTR